METKIYYNNYTKLADIFERYAAYDFDQKLINFLLGECANFLYARGLTQDVVKYLSIEFEVSSDQSFVGIRGGNLMASMWLCDIFPPNPEKYIIENVCIFQKKKYIYDPNNKSLKIKNYADRKLSSTP